MLRCSVCGASCRSWLGDPFSCSADIVIVVVVVGLVATFVDELVEGDVSKQAKDEVQDEGDDDGLPAGEALCRRVCGVSVLSVAATALLAAVGVVLVACHFVRIGVSCDGGCGW